MARASAKTAESARRPSAPVTATLAWLLPGLGHWWLGERTRGVVFFTIITVTFWGGIAVGGVRSTVTPRENGAWIAAQLCMGPQALSALWWSNQRTIAHPTELKAPWPASNIGVVYAGVAGLLNLLVIIDVLARVESRQMALASKPPPQRDRSP